MITIEKHNPENKRKVAESLRKRGYISQQSLNELTYDKLEELSLSSKILDDKNIKNLFAPDDSPYLCICVEYTQTSKRYWYRLSDLQKIYVPSKIR